MAKSVSAQPRALDPKRLIELLRIAQYGSYTKAAEIQGVSQPALSRSISILERNLSVPLLKRTRRGAELTEFGAHLIGYAKTLEALLQRAAADIHQKSLGLDGSLAVGVSPVACADLVPEAIVRMRSVSPGVSVSIQEGPDDWLLSRLRSGEIDLMVSPVGLSSEASDISREVLLLDTFAVVARPGSHLTKLGGSLSELRGVQWIMPSPDTVMWNHIQALFAAENVAWPENCVTSNSVLAIKSILMRSDYVTIASRELMSPEIDAGYLVCIEMRKKAFAREICLRTHNDRDASPLCNRFIESLREVASELRDGSRSLGGGKKAFHLHGGVRRKPRRP